MDRIGIPTICAIVPASADDLSIYNGKGLTREHALVSAIMEAVERQTAAECRVRHRDRKPRRVRSGLDLRACGIREEYMDRSIAFVEAYDILHDAEIEVPKALVQMPWHGDTPFPVTHTNGLASGFTTIEAVYHALFELVERHLWALVHARAHLRPRRILATFFESLGAGGMVPAFRDRPVTGITLPTGNAVVDDLYRCVSAAGLRLRLVAMAEPHFPTAILASIHEPAPGAEQFHAGCGCSWSPIHACVRAITEAVQARSADIQGARENILRADDPPSRFTTHTRRRPELPYGRWYFDGPLMMMDLVELPDRSSDDLYEELQRLVSAVATVASRIAVVRLAPPCASYSVVRVIVPELETTAIDGRLGAATRKIININADPATNPKIFPKKVAGASKKNGVISQKTRENSGRFTTP